MPLRRLFAITSILFFVVLAISPLKNALRPYRAIQREYAKLGVARAKSQKAAQAYQARPVSIQQIWLPNLQNRVDRCTTCHLGVQDENMAGAPGVFRLHSRSFHTPKDFDRFGCTSCHGGQGLATLEEDAHGHAENAGTPMTPLPFIESGCGRCHQSEQVAGAAILSKGRKLMEKAGCFSCHLVKGHEGFRSEAPPLGSVALKTGGEALKRWLKDPKGLDPNASMPNFHLSDADIEALTHYIFNTQPSDLLSEKVRLAAADKPGDAVNGKKIFAEARCISCHTLEGKGNGSAPELSKVASRATQPWMLAFLRDPQAFNPRTRMPRFGFSEADTRDVVAYMVAEFKDFEAPPAMLDPVHVNQTLAEKGQKLFRQLGCTACHTTSDAADRIGPELNRIGDKRAASLDFGKRKDVKHTLPAWLQAKLEDPRSLGQGLKMPAYGFSPEDTRAVVTALLSLGAEPVPDRYQFTPLTRASLVPGGTVGALFDRYRCLSCHQIGDKGGDISTAPLTAEGSKVKKEWVAEYLVLSYTIRPILTDRMPVFRMTKEDAATLASAFETFYLDPSIPEDPYQGQPASSRDPAEGKHIFDTLGCKACHIQGDKGGYYGPPLNEAGRRLKPGWTYSWLKSPQRWRADVRCPNYGLTDADALKLTSFLQTLVQKPATPKGGHGGAK